MPLRAHPRLRRAGAVLHLYLLAGGLVSFLGWALDQPRLTDWFGTGISIQPNTAIATMLASAGLVAFAAGWRRTAAAIGAMLTLIGGSVLVEYVSGLDFGVDTLFLFDRTWGGTGVLSPGLMGGAAATSFTLLGVALALATRPGRWRRIAPFLALAPACIACLGLVGYAYGAHALYTVPRLTAIAAQTATFLLAGSVALVMSMPGHGPMRLFLDTSAGGLLARRAFPVILLVPFLIGLADVEADRSAFYEHEFGSALKTLAEMILLTGFLWGTASMLRRQVRARGQAQRALTASHERFYSVVDNLSDGFVILDREWRLTYVNSQAERMLRRRRAELLGRNCWQVWPAAVGGIAWRELHRCAAERCCVSFEEWLEESQRWFSTKAQPTLDGAIAVSFEDVTTRRQAEADLRQSRARLEKELADSRLLHRISTELIVEHDSTRFYDSIVETAAHIMSADFATIQRLHVETAELELLAWRGFTPKIVASWRRVGTQSRNASGEALRRGQRVVIGNVDASELIAGTVDLAAYRQIGVHALQCTPVISRGGTVIGMISTHWRTPYEPGERQFLLMEILARQAADIIEHRRAEEERERLLRNERAARTSAEQAARLKDEFLATLSHELRTPLHAVIGWSQLLRQDLLDADKARTAVEVIERNARLQAQLITDLLDISRITSGSMRLDARPAGLSGIVDAAIESVLPAASARGVRIERLPFKAPDLVNGDPARLQQIVWNLLSNAVKFTPRGGRVRVSVARAGPNVQVRVTDTGEGITPEFLPHIFERFRQADASSSRKQGGLGLGLAIVKELVELHGGRVRAASEGPGTGSTFVVELPLLVKSAESSVHGEAAAEQTCALHRLDGIRVLLVDDEPDALAMIRRNLEDDGAAVATASTAEAALEQLGEGGFDVMVSDIGLPGRDGYELLVEARTRGIRVPALALTAFARPQDRLRALASGYQSHLAKPVDTSELLTTVASLASQQAQAGSGVPA